jgi:inositol oxygenase
MASKDEKKAVVANGTAASVSSATAGAASAAAPGMDIVLSAPKAIDTNGKSTEAFRNYENSKRQAGVEAFYKEKNAKQTYAFVESMERRYGKPSLGRMGLWECLEFLDTFVDNSDPDTENSQMQHALQTAEAIRAAYPAPEHDWFALVGLIHDLGKILSPKGGEPQFAVVGDTHPVGCAFDKANVFHSYFAANPDAANAAYSSVNGIYKPHCGLRNVKMSFGHDEYLYQTAVRNGTTLPAEGLCIIRYHSFYPMHSSGAYKHLMDASDEANLKWIQTFQKFDLYSKAHTKYDPKQLKPVYAKLIEKYFPNGAIDW